MRRLVIVFALAAVSTLLVASQSLAAGVRPRIVQGTETSIAHAPFQVALYDPQLVDAQESQNILSAQFCGGVIRDATHVVTAAHCVTLGGFEAAAPEEIAVLAGSANLEAPEAGSIKDAVVATSFDPEWEPLGYGHDVGVLTLEKPLWTEATPAIDGTSKIAPIAFASIDPSPGSAATVSGWGFDQPLTAEQFPSEAEEEADHPAVLHSAEVSIVSRSQCSADYAEEGLEAFGEDLICANGSGPTPADACYGDSGGPLFSGEPGNPLDRLLGLVDFGAGCGQPGSPGVYQSVVEVKNRAFATSNPPQAPLNRGQPTIGGDLVAGQAVTCNPGVWLGAPQFFYRFYRDESSISRPFAVKALTAKFTTSSTFTTQPAEAGTRVFCAVGALNAGGLGEAISDDATLRAPAIVATAPVTPGPPPPPVAKPAPPTLHVASARCRRGACTVNVRASHGVGDALVTKVEANLMFTRKFACRKHGRRATCRRLLTRKLTARKMPGEHFSIFVDGLKPGAYTMALVAIDKVGVRETHATRVPLLLKPAGKPR